MEPENEKKNKTTTIVIVIVALCILFSCMIISCCSAGLYFFMKSGGKDAVEVLINDSGKSQDKSNEDLKNEETKDEEPKNEENKGGENQKDDGISEGIGTTNGLTPFQSKVIKKVEEIRGLTAAETMAPVYQTKDELREYLKTELYAGATEQDFADERDLLNILGFVPDGFDVEKFHLDMYTEQIAGFYDQNTDKMYLIEDASELSNAQTLAHEYTHYLQFHNFDFNGKLNYDDEGCEENSENCVILDAVTEGDATLTESLLTSDKDLDLSDDTDESDSGEDLTVFNSAPKYYQDSLLFSYQNGFDFVYSQYLKGGFDYVNKLYENPPESIEQVMHPTKYLKDHPVEINIDPFISYIKSAGGELSTQSVLNEADILWLLESAYKEDWRLTEKQAKKSSEGWGGGAYQFARVNGKSLFFSKTAWDSKKEAQEFYDGMTKYNELRWGKAISEDNWQSDKERVVLIKQDDIVYWMVAPVEFPTAGLVEMINGGLSL